MNLKPVLFFIIILVAVGFIVLNLYSFFVSEDQEILEDFSDKAEGEIVGSPEDDLGVSSISPGISGNVVSGSLVGEGSGASGAGSEAGGVSGGSGGEYIEPSCSLVQPGQEEKLVFCSVNHILEDEISLHIDNQLGSEAVIRIRLEECEPEHVLGSSKEGAHDLDFSCNNEEYYEGDVFITYEFEDVDPITIFGVVQGSVS